MQKQLGAGKSSNNDNEKQNYNYNEKQYRIIKKIDDRLPVIKFDPKTA